MCGVVRPPRRSLRCWPRSIPTSDLSYAVRPREDYALPTSLTSLTCRCWRPCEPSPDSPSNSNTVVCGHVRDLPLRWQLDGCLPCCRARALALVNALLQTTTAEPHERLTDRAGARAPGS